MSISRLNSRSWWFSRASTASVPLRPKPIKRIQTRLETPPSNTRTRLPPLDDVQLVQEGSVNERSATIFCDPWSNDFVSRTCPFTDTDTAISWAQTCPRPDRDHLSRLLAADDRGILRSCHLLGRRSPQRIKRQLFSFRRIISTCITIICGTRHSRYSVLFCSVSSVDLTFRDTRGSNPERADGTVLTVITTACSLPNHYESR